MGDCFGKHKKKKDTTDETNVIGNALINICLILVIRDTILNTLCAISQLCPFLHTPGPALSMKILQNENEEQKVQITFLGNSGTSLPTSMNACLHT